MNSIVCVRARADVAELSARASLMQWAVRAWKKTPVRALSRSSQSSQTRGIHPFAYLGYSPSPSQPESEPRPSPSQARFMRDLTRCWSPVAARACWRRARWRSAVTGCCSCGKRSAACWPKTGWCFTHTNTTTTIPTTPAARWRSCTSPTWRQWTAWSARGSTCTSRWWCPRAERSTSGARRTRAGTRRSRSRWSSTRTARRSWPWSPAGRSSSSCWWSPRRRCSETRSRTRETRGASPECARSRDAPAWKRVAGARSSRASVRCHLVHLDARADALHALKDITAELSSYTRREYHLGDCRGAGASCHIEVYCLAVVMPVGFKHNNYLQLWSVLWIMPSK